MLLIKKMGDLMFKQESLGGGDIKLMFLVGLTLDPLLSIIVIFLASIIALPISLVLLIKNKEHVIPFGPFLALGAFFALLLGDGLIQWYLSLFF